MVADGGARAPRYLNGAEQQLDRMSRFSWPPLTRVLRTPRGLSYARAHHRRHRSHTIHTSHIRSWPRRYKGDGVVASSSPPCRRLAARAPIGSRSIFLAMVDLVLNRRVGTSIMATRSSRCSRTLTIMAIPTVGIGVSMAHYQRGATPSTYTRLRTSRQLTRLAALLVTSIIGPNPLANSVLRRRAVWPSRDDARMSILRHAAAKCGRAALNAFVEHSLHSLNHGGDGSREGRSRAPTDGGHRPSSLGVPLPVLTARRPFAFGSASEFTPIGIPGSGPCTTSSLLRRTLARGCARLRRHARRCDGEA